MKEVTARVVIQTALDLKFMVQDDMDIHSPEMAQAVNEAVEFEMFSKNIKDFESEIDIIK